jgi:hypothetical protein
VIHFRLCNISLKHPTLFAYQDRLESQESTCENSPSPKERNHKKTPSKTTIFVLVEKREWKWYIHAVHLWLRWCNVIKLEGCQPNGQWELHLPLKTWTPKLECWQAEKWAEKKTFTLMSCQGLDKNCKES